MYLKTRIYMYFSFINVQPRSFVLIEYPKDFRHCWRPAVILGPNEEKTAVCVRFYDCIDENLSNNENVIQITEEQFTCYVKDRIRFECSLKSAVVVGLNENTNTFMLGTIIDRARSGHRYLIKWSNEKESEQEEELLFGAFTRRIEPQVGDLVLAMNDIYTYQPAEVKAISGDKKTLTVRFLNSTNDNR